MSSRALNMIDFWKLRFDGSSRLQEEVAEAVEGEEIRDESVDEIEMEWKGRYLYSTAPRHAFLIGDCSESRQCTTCE
jgi:hypothetical protein